MASAVAEEVKHEIDRSEEAFGSFHSLHEGLAVLREEFLELENEVFWREDKAKTDSVRKEAIQTAAMAMRIVLMVSPVPVEVPDDVED
jgi:hypothetical protein